MVVRTVACGVAVGLLAVLAGCGPKYSPNTYSAEAVQQANKVERGVIVGVRGVGVSADATIGTVTGAAAGGITGSQVGAGGPISALGAVGGTLVGGLIGGSVQHATGDTKAYEYVVRQSNGDLVSVTQKDTVPLEIGQTVLVIAGKQARVVPDYTVAVPREPMPPAPAKTATKPAPPAKPPAAEAGNPGPVEIPQPPGAAGHAVAGAPLMAPAAAPPVGGAPADTVGPPPSAAAPMTPTGTPAAARSEPMAPLAGTSGASAETAKPESVAPASATSPGMADQPGAPISLALPAAEGPPPGQTAASVAKPPSAPSD